MSAGLLQEVTKAQDYGRRLQELRTTLGGNKGSGLLQEFTRAQDYFRR